MQTSAAKVASSSARGCLPSRAPPAGRRVRGHAGTQGLREASGAGPLPEPGQGGEERKRALWEMCWTWDGSTAVVHSEIRRTRSGQYNSDPKKREADACTEQRELGRTPRCRAKNTNREM